MPYGQQGWGRQPYYSQVQNSASSAATLMQRVSYMLCTALLVTAAAAYVSPAFASLWLLWMIGTFVCVFAISRTRQNTALGAVLLYVLSALEGLMIGPFVMAVARGYPYGGVIVAEATALSGIIVAGIGSYVWITNKDFGYLGKMLFYALIGVIVVGVISLFWHSLAAMSGFQLSISMLIVAIFVGFTLYDFSNIKLRYGPNDYVIATVALYLDFLNLFMAILRILMIVAGGGNSNRRS